MSGVNLAAQLIVERHQRFNPRSSAFGLNSAPRGPFQSARRLSIHFFNRAPCT